MDTKQRLERCLDTSGRPMTPLAGSTNGNSETMPSHRQIPASENGSIRIIKLGGSLLDLPALPGVLLRALNAWPPMRNVIVVGGGQAADLIREWDKHWQLGEQRSHRMAIFAMTWNARQIFGNTTEFELAAHPSTISESGKPCVILPEPFLNSVVLNGTEECLPKSWQITSDSIAAYVATIMKADQLVLLKSTDCASGKQPSQPVQSAAEEPEVDRFRLVEISEESTLQKLANHNLVDCCFPRYASAVPNVFWCNFRGSHRQNSIDKDF